MLQILHTIECICPNFPQAIREDDVLQIPHTTECICPNLHCPGPDCVGCFLPARRIEHQLFSIPRIQHTIFTRLKSCVPRIYLKGLQRRRGESIRLNIHTILWE